MNESLKIECEWWGSANGEKDISQACRGAIGINVGENCLTRLEDTWGNTVRNQLNASAHTLALWFAGNWWRLRWEPETPSSRSDVDWHMSHSMASAGEGYCWPSILFASDGDALAVASRATRGRVMGPVRFLNEVNTLITANAFESGIDAFLTLVLSRLHGEGYRNSELAELWTEVQNEREDPKLAQWRRLEAICGYDPGEAPEALIDMLVADTAQLGGKALEEVAAEGRHSTAEVLNRILDLATATDEPKAGGFRGTLPKIAVTPGFEAGERPWQRATRFARLARKEWGLGDEPVSNAQLADLLGNRASVFDEVDKGTAPMPLLLREANHDKVDFYLNRAHPTSRRFAASRLLGDNLLHSNEGRLNPATTAKTARQQFQRAFAQEFLCPFDALRAKIQTTMPDEDDIAEAASYFNVSTRVIEATLVNKGELDREALSWIA
jgi:Zn-dependent peptidase ImmA (M78 family)